MAEFPKKTAFRSQMGSDPSDYLANQRHQYIEITHMPTNHIVRFKAYITDFKDKFDPQWEETDGFGRMDSISKFKKTGRNISLSWDVPSSSEEEAIFNWEKLNLISQFLMPTYNGFDGGAATIKNSPLWRIKFMNFIQRVDASGQGLLGAVTSFDSQINFDIGFFDRLDRRSNSANLYPKLYNISLSFSVKHEHELGWTDDELPREGFRNFPYGNSAISFESRGKNKKDKKTSADDRRGSTLAARLRNARRSR